MRNSGETTLLDKIKECLKTCNTFSIYAFNIDEFAFELLKSDMSFALSRNIIGRIITSSYVGCTNYNLLFDFYSNWMEHTFGFDCKIDINRLDKQSYDEHPKQDYLFYYTENGEFVFMIHYLDSYVLNQPIKRSPEIEEKYSINSYDVALSNFNRIWNELEELDYQKHIWTQAQEIRKPIIEKYGSVENYFKEIEKYKK